MSGPADPRWRRGAADLGGATLHWIEAGSGPLVVLLHGFPDSPHGWRHQLPALADAGYRAVAPWLRGYGPSSRPPRVDDYRLEPLAADVAALVAALGAKRATAVVGHDWGGAIAWRLAATRPDLVERLVVVNSPHPASFRRALRSPRQMARSSYMLFFQLPWLPERLLARRGLAPVRVAVAREVRRAGAFGRAEWEPQREALAAPGALRSAINYYRAAARQLLRGRTDAGVGGEVVAVPTLVLWGERDSFLLPELAERQRAHAPDVVVRRFPDAGHWVHWDEPEGVNAALVGWLRDGGGGGR